MSTYRTAVNVIRAFPQVVEQVRQTVDPLDIKFEVMREINWQLNRLPNDAAVIRCMKFLMEERGFTSEDFKEE